jgi:hypothetical protein
MIDWIYSNPTALWGTILVAAITGVACGGLVLFHRHVDVEIRRKHNDVAAATMAIVGIAYAVLIAFIAVATWEAFGAADKIVDTEASAIGNLYRDTIGLSAEKAAPMRADIKTYLHEVVNDEWPTQQHGETKPLARKTLVHLHSLVARIEPQTPGEEVIMGELIHSLNDLYNARRTRILASDDSIPEIVWWIVGLGTVITIFFTFLFGSHDFRMHLAMTGLTAASMGLVIVLIVSLDRPFRGDLSVSTEAYHAIEDAIDEAEKG